MQLDNYSDRLKITFSLEPVYQKPCCCSNLKKMQAGQDSNHKRSSVPHTHCVCGGRGRGLLLVLMRMRAPGCVLIHGKSTGSYRTLWLSRALALLGTHYMVDCEHF